MAARTKHKTHSARPRSAASTIARARENQRAGAVGDLPDLEPDEQEAEPRETGDPEADQDTLDAADEASADLPDEVEDDESTAEDRALVPSDEADEDTEDGEDDEDLRLAPVYTDGSAVSQTAARSSTPRLVIPRWAMRTKFTRFLAESLLELTKVTWPEARVARNMTLIVIGMSVFVAVVLGAADYGLTQFVQWVISHAAPVVPSATPTPPLSLPGQ